MYSLLTNISLFFNYQKNKTLQYYFVKYSDDRIKCRILGIINKLCDYSGNRPDDAPPDSETLFKNLINIPRSSSIILTKSFRPSPVFNSDYKWARDLLIPICSSVQFQTLFTDVCLLSFSLKFNAYHFWDFLKFANFSFPNLFLHLHDSQNCLTLELLDVQTVWLAYNGFRTFVKSV